MAVEVSGQDVVTVVVPAGDSVSVSVGLAQQGGVDAYGGIGPTIFVNGTATGVVGTIGINPFLAGPNITISTAGGSITVIGRDPPVSSVAGKTGAVSLSHADVTASPLVHTHGTSDVVGLTAMIKSFANVFSVQGKTGTVTLTTADLTAAAASHTHSTTDIANFTSSVRSVSPVFSVQGKTGTVTLTTADLTAAAASHTHSTTDVSGLTATIKSFANVFSVQGKTGTVTLTTADLTAAAASHTHDAANVASGVLLPARLGSGTPTTATFLRGDSTWSAMATSGSGFVGTSSLAVASGSLSGVAGGFLNTASGDSSLVAGGRNNTASGEGALAGGMGSIAYSRGMHARATDYFASPGDAQAIDLTFLGAMTLQAGGTTDIAMYEGELYLNLAAGQRWNPPIASKAYFGKLLVTAVGREGQQWSMEFPLFSHATDGDILWSIASGIAGDSFSSITNTRRYFSIAPTLAIQSTATGLSMRLQATIASGFPAQSPANAIGTIRCVARFIGVECGIPLPSTYY